MIEKIGAGIVLYFFILWLILPLCVANASYIKSVKISHIAASIIIGMIIGVILVSWSFKVLLV